MSVEIQARDGGLVVPVRAQPGARRNAVVGEHGGALKIAVQAPPEDGKANDAITALLRKSLGLTRGQITLLSGQTSRDKKFLILGLTREILEAKIATLTGNA